MKWNSINSQSYEQLDYTEDFFLLLSQLGIRSADRILEEIDDNKLDFCSECHNTKEDCECHYDYDRRMDDSDRAYDAWKDRMMEEGE